MAETSTAAMATTRPARYAKQLAAHMSRKVPASWDDASATGRITFPTARLELSLGSDALLLELTSEAQDLERWEGVVGSHLVRFGTRDELVVAWRRGDGTDGTVQRTPEDGPAPGH